MCYVNDQPGVLVGVNVYHVTHGAISEGWAEYRYVVLGVREGEVGHYTTFQDGVCIINVNREPSAKA